MQPCLHYNRSRKSRWEQSPPVRENSKRVFHPRDVIGYQTRQSFAPSEVTPEQALEFGYELAKRCTKGKHQFVVAAHTNTNNPHTHIFINSVDLTYSRKWQDFKYSAIALRRVSDMICLENGLSIIEKLGLSKGSNRAEYSRLARLRPRAIFCAI
jgi:type IV secretory pathway VirD2 relaxase